MGWFKGLLNPHASDENRRIRQIAERRVVPLESAYRRMSAKELSEVTLNLRDQLASGVSAENVLPQAIAACNEAMLRALAKRISIDDIVAAIGLAFGYLVPLPIGEKRFQVPLLAAYMGCLGERGVHLVSTGDEIACRRAQIAGKVLGLLGATVGALRFKEAFLYDLFHGQESPDAESRYLSPVKRNEAYAADVTYGAFSEFAFDYLYDNMELQAESLRQRRLDYAILDQADRILIDWATQPIIVNALKEDPPLKKQSSSHAKRERALEPVYASVLVHEYFTMYQTLAGVSQPISKNEARFLLRYPITGVLNLSEDTPRCKKLPDAVFGTVTEKCGAVVAKIRSRTKTNDVVIVFVHSIKERDLIAEGLRARKMAFSEIDLRSDKGPHGVLKVSGLSGSVCLCFGIPEYELRISPSDENRRALGIVGMSTERLTRRIDEQLFGVISASPRAKEFQFFISLEDNLFKSMPKWLRPVMQKLGLADGQRIESKSVSGAIAKRQENSEQEWLEQCEAELQSRRSVFKYQQQIYNLRMQMLSTDIDLPFGELVVLSMPFEENGEPGSKTKNHELGISGKWIKEYLDIASASLVSVRLEKGDVRRLAKERIGQALQRVERELEPNNALAYIRELAVSALDDHWRQFLSKLSLNPFAPDPDLPRKISAQRREIETEELFSTMLRNLVKELWRRLGEVSNPDNGN